METVEQKQCIDCGKIKNIDDFRCLNKDRGYYYLFCKKCSRNRIRISQAVVIDGKRKCTRCKQIKPIDAFNRAGKTSTGMQTYNIQCKQCANNTKKEYRKNNPEKLVDSDLKRNYGISLADYERMFKTQNGLCAICNKPDTKRRLSVDHDHKTGKNRELLCSLCNLTLGHLSDDPELFDRAAAYLRRHQCSQDGNIG